MLEVDSTIARQSQVAPLPQARQQARQMRITTRRWAPVDMYDRDTVRGELCSKKFQAEVNHPWASREQRR